MCQASMVRSKMPGHSYKKSPDNYMFEVHNRSLKTDDENFVQYAIKYSHRQHNTEAKRDDGSDNDDGNSSK